MGVNKGKQHLNSAKDLEELEAMGSNNELDSERIEQSLPKSVYTQKKQYQGSVNKNRRIDQEYGSELSGSSEDEAGPSTEPITDN